MSILKISGSCLVPAMAAAVLALPHWRTENKSIGQVRTLAQKSQERILSAPSSIAYSVIESAVSLAVEPSLDPEHLETEASWQTPADQI